MSQSIQLLPQSSNFTSASAYYVASISQHPPAFITQEIMSKDKQIAELKEKLKAFEEPQFAKPPSFAGKPHRVLEL